MSGDWIKMRSDLFTHPKVVRISSAMKADNLRTVGGLMSVWCLFDAHSVDGVLEGYTAETVDNHLRWTGFSAAMAAVGWLIEEESCLKLPRFDAHNGQSAKKRAQDADRKREAREAERLSALEADKERTREEKRREESNTEIPNGISSASTDAKPQRSKPAKNLDYSKWPERPSDQVMTDWISHRKSKRAPISQTVIDRLAGELSLANRAGYSVDDCLSMAMMKGWQGFEYSWLLRAASNGQTIGNTQPVNRPDNSVPGRIKAAAARQHAAAAGHAGHDVAMGRDGQHVRPQMGEQLRDGDRREQGMGSVIEGTFTRSD